MHLKLVVLKHLDIMDHLMNSKIEFKSITKTTHTSQLKHKAKAHITGKYERI